MRAKGGREDSLGEIGGRHRVKGFRNIMTQTHTFLIGKEIKNFKLIMVSGVTDVPNYPFEV